MSFLLLIKLIIYNMLNYGTTSSFLTLHPKIKFASPNYGPLPDVKSLFLDANTQKNKDFRFSLGPQLSKQVQSSAQLISRLNGIRLGSEVGRGFILAELLLQTQETKEMAALL